MERGKLSGKGMWCFYIGKKGCAIRGMARRDYGGVRRDPVALQRGITAGYAVIPWLCKEELRRGTP